jgi:hypothetical protein
MVLLRLLASTSIFTIGFFLISHLHSVQDKKLLQILQIQNNESAERVLSWMDNSTLPCDDFYQYSCGGILKNPLKYDEFNRQGAIIPFSFKMRNQDKALKMKEILDNEDNPIHKAMQCCMKVTSFQNFKDEAFKAAFEFTENLVENVFYGQRDLDKLSRFWKTISALRNQVFEISKNVRVSEPSITIRFKGFLKMDVDDMENRFKNGFLMQDHDFEFLKSFYMDVSAINISKNFHYKSFDLDKISNQYPDIPFSMFIDPFTGSDLNIVINEGFIGDISAVHNLLKDLDDQKIASFLTFVITLYISNDNLSRQSICSSLLSYYPTELKNSLYDYPTNLETRKIYHYLRSAIIDAVNSAEWMDDLTKSNALTKALRMSEFVQIPNVDYGYKPLEICAPKEFYLNLLNRKYDIAKTRWEYPFEKVNRLQWPSSMLSYDSLQYGSGGYSMVNAFYVPTSNIFVLPYGILGRPFFEMNRPVSMNFGSVGMVSAHELSQ